MQRSSRSHSGCHSLPVDLRASCNQASLSEPLISSRSTDVAIGPAPPSDFFSPCSSTRILQCHEGSKWLQILKACQDIQGHSIFQSISSFLASINILIYPFRCISMSLQNESSLSFHASNHRKGWEHKAIEVKWQKCSRAAVDSGHALCVDEQLW